MPQLCCVRMQGPDTRMDEHNVYRVVNPLTVLCAECAFPDLDFIPQPYFLISSRITGATEMALAYLGNFFVNNRVRNILEQACPGLCKFYPTLSQNTIQQQHEFFRSARGLGWARLARQEARPPPE